MPSERRRENGANGQARRGFLARLARDSRGNTLAIVGAALIPLTAMIGSGVDMSRAYMAKTRLQSACDAASLAGRRVMQNDTMSPAVEAEALRFFDFNFPEGLYQTAEFDPVVTRPVSGTIRVTASTTIPTAVMHLFGFQNLPLSVSCDASLNFVNTDVMMVLDVTGSMAWNVAGTQTSGVPAADQRITALREAVMALYDELEPVQEQLEDNGLRLRYGVVPYSSAVNVGGLIRSVNPDYLVNSATYQSRVLNYNTVESYEVTGSSSTQTSETWGATLSSTACNSYATNRSYTTLDGAGPFHVSGSQASGSVVTRTYSLRDWGGTGTTSGWTRTCRRWRTDTTTTYVPSRYRFTDATYRAVTYDTSQYKLGNPVTIATDTGGTVPAAPSPRTFSMQQLPDAATGVGTTTSTWNGCIEERDTVSTITASSGYSIPSGATDLNINLIPNSDTTRWRPMWPRIAYRRTGGWTSTSNGSAIWSSTSEANFACPAEARRLQAWGRGALQSYVNGLQPIGGTYHDIGMIWGARMISSGGIFADSPDTFAGMPVSRHVIFMTDGELSPNCNTYTSYGIEQNSMRVTGGGSCPDQHARHLQRFKMICNATKSLNVSIWVIAFGTSLSDEMIECASNANQASTSANRDDLIARFRQIGSQIGALRLTQ